MEGNQSKSSLPEPKPSKTCSQIIYVKKWLKTKHAILFRLSNKVVQVMFEDKSQLIMSSVSKKVSYLNKKGERSIYYLSTALESGNTEMIKRLNYSR